MQEIWKDVPGYEELYKVSNLGRVKSLDKISSFQYKNGRKEKRLSKGRILKPLINTKGRLQVSLSKNNNSKLYQIHVLVALAFIGPYPEDNLVRHLDDNPKNNSLDNLAYGTIQQNMIDAYKNGINHQKLSIIDVKNIRELIDDGLNLTSISFLYGISIDAVSKIKRKIRFNWIK